jgi:hypothetical protein
MKRSLGGGDQCPNSATNKALLEHHSAKRRRERDREEARQRGRLLIAEREKSLPADVPLHKRGFGVMDEEAT